MSDQFMISNIVVNTVNLKGLTTHTINPGVVESLNAGSSELDPATVHVLRSEPVATVGCVDIEDLLDLAFDVAGTGYTIPHIPVTTEDCDIWFTAVEAAATHGGALKNTQAHISKCTLVVRSIANNAEGIAEAQVEIYADHDGTNAPIAFTLDQSLPGGLAGGSSDLWTIRALKNGSAGSILYKLGAITLDFGITVQRQRPSNSIYATDTVVAGFRPAWRWTTDDLATALAASGLSGAVAATGGLICYLGKYDASVPGVAATGALTLTLAATSPWYTEGFALGGEVPTVLNYVAQGLGGTTLATPPMTYSSTGVDLPTESTDAAIFGPGPIKENAVEKELLAGNVDFGLRWEFRGSGAVPWPTLGLITRREPTITVQTADMDYVVGLGIEGRMVNTSFFAYLRKYTQNGEPSSAASVHIAVSCTAGLIKPSELGGPHATLLPGGFIVRPTGGLTLSTTSSI